jgi:hypothetical protein
VRWPGAGLLFAIGFGGGLLGDAFHVKTGTTAYFSRAHAVPFLALSPLWFPVATGLATVVIAAVRVRTRPVRTGRGARHGLAGIAAVLGLYAVTAAVHTQPTAVSVTLISAAAVIIWCAVGDLVAVPLAASAAILGPMAEITVNRVGIFRYAAGSDGLFGVAPWLPALYFAFGVVACLLGEAVVATTRISVVSDGAAAVPAPTR